MAEQAENKRKFHFNLSIKVYLLVLLTTLLGLVVIPILFCNSYFFERLLLNFSKESASLSSLIISNKITNYFLPIADQTEMTERLIRENVIVPEDSQSFRKYMAGLSRIANVYAVLWADEQGTLNILTHYRGESVLDNVILYQASSGKKSVRRSLDRNGNILEEHVIPPVAFDSRNRSWYKVAKVQKTQSWTEVFRPILFSELFQKSHEMLVNMSTIPIYNKAGEFLGVFSIAADLISLDQSVKQLADKKNMSIVVIDQQGNLIAPYDIQWYRKYYPSFNKVQNMSEIGMPAITASYQYYVGHYGSIWKTDHEMLFSFPFQREKYLAFYVDLSYTVKQKWYIGIVLPEDDVYEPEQKLILFASSIALFIFLVGIALSFLLSRKIAKPITLLAHDTTHITQDFNFETEDSKIETRVKEIAVLQKAFEVMKKGLNSFTRYIPKTLIQNIIKKEIIPQVGGDSRPLTLLFVDIKGFTALSENIEPQKLMGFLSEYFEAMTSVIFKYNGTVDKYIGDAVMAFWGAPTSDENQELHACQCALDMLDALEKLNQNWQESHLPTIQIKISIHSGQVIVGNVGSSDRLSYTAIGDNVNLASRIESLNAYYGTRIIVTEATYLAAEHQYAFRLLDYVTVRGKQQAVYLYELLGLKESPRIVYSNRYHQIFKQAFDAYRKGEWDKAIALFQELQKDYAQDTLLTLFINRCALLKTKNPAHWNGTWVMENK